MKAWLIFVSLFLSVQLMAAEQPCATGAISLIEGKWYQSSIYPAQLAGGPTWRPDVEPLPPLSPGRVVALATRKIRQLFPKVSDWQVSQVMLTWTLKPEHWYYQVLFSRFSTEGREGEEIPTFSILVLMNGKVIQPSIMQTKATTPDRPSAP